MAMESQESDRIEARIEKLIALVGTLIGVASFLGWGFRAGEAAVAGAALCWLNFRWLRQGAAGVIRLGLAQAGKDNVQIPKILYAKFLGRIALVALVVYVILRRLHLPIVPLFCGVTAVFPAILIELGYEVIHGQHRCDAQ